MHASILRARHARRPDPCSAERGSVLIWALLFAIITSAMIISHSTYLASNRRTMRVRFENVTLADSFARSGLTDALEWYKRQHTQPVVAFDPQSNPDGDPPIMDTLDPTIGLVREFEVRGNLWTRYEVRKADVRDISAERGISTAGSVWDVGARSYLFLRNDEDQPFDQGENRVLASSYMRGEMQGIAIRTPAPAAITVRNPSQLDIGPNARIDGGDGAAIAYPNTELPPAFPGGTVVGTPAVVAIAGFDDSPQRTFEMDIELLASLSDYALDAATITDSPGGDGGDGFAGSTFGRKLNPTPDVQPRLALGMQEGESWWSWYRQNYWSIGSRTSLRSYRNYVYSFRRWYYTNHEESAEAAIADYEAALLAGPEPVGASQSLTWITGHTHYVEGQGQSQSAIQAPDIENKTVFFRGDLTMNANRSLLGNALVVVDGNLTIEDENKSKMSGLIYVTGDADINGEFELTGSLIVRGRLRIGYGTNPTLIRADQQSIDDIKRSVERYRLSRTVRPGWSTP